MAEPEGPEGIPSAFPLRPKWYTPTVRGFIDLHCHFIPRIDDGARTYADSRAILEGLRRIGFEKVIATPHMRPGMFPNTKEDLERAYAATAPLLQQADLPEIGLSAEHYFDDIVFSRLLTDEALPYPGGKAVLVEFSYDAFPLHVAFRFFDLRRKGLRPVIAHPERYRPVWKDVRVLDPLLEAGAALLLDVAALVGKYGRASQKAAEALLEAGYYDAACSDAHRPSDIDEVSQGIHRLEKICGKDEAAWLLREGPERILAGTLDG